MKDVFIFINGGEDGHILLVTEEIPSDDQMRLAQEGRFSILHIFKDGHGELAVCKLKRIGLWIEIF